MKIVRRNYFILLILGFVFAAPGISAYFFYTHPQWLGAATTNKGVFLDPPVPLVVLAQDDRGLHPNVVGFEAPRAKKTGIRAKTVGLSKGRQWQLVLWSPGACKKSCIEQLDKLARIRLALGRHLYDVVPRLLLAANAPPLTPALARALQEQDIHVLTLPAGARERMPVLKNQLEIFIANPDNYLVLAYVATVKPGDIFHDIKQLLNTTDTTRK